MALNALRRRRRRHEICQNYQLLSKRRIADRENPLEVLHSDEVFARYRFRPNSILFITSLLFENLARMTRRSVSLPPLLQVLICLRFYASGAFYTVVGDTIRLSKSTVCRCVAAVGCALVRLRNDWITMPGNAAATKQAFYSIAGFPNVISVVDGTMVRIQRPKENDIDFLNRKGYHSLNVQMSCTPDFRITSCCAKWPGSVHDNRVFRDSNLCLGFESGLKDGFLLGDSAYGSRRYMLTPYPVCVTPAQENYNKAHSRTRVVIEQAFGVLKRRFPCLHFGFRLTPQKACMHSINCVILHNIGILKGDVLTFEQPETEDEAWQVTVPHEQEGVSVRQFITQQYFSE